MGPWNWSIWRAHFSTYTPILDFIHAAQYLFAAAKAWETNDAARWSGYLELAAACWQGRVAQMIEPLHAELAARGLAPDAEVAHDSPSFVTALPDVSVSEDAQDTVVQLLNYFADPDLPGGDTLTYTITSNTNPTLVGTSFVGNALVLKFKDDQSGTASITVRATDGGGLFASDTFTVTVAALADPPRVDWIKNRPSVIRRGGTLTLEAAASGPDSTITEVHFYRDANGDRTYDAGDILLGTDTTATGGVYSIVTSATTRLQGRRGASPNPPCRFFLAKPGHVVRSIP